MRRIVLAMPMVALLAGCGGSPSPPTTATSGPATDPGSPEGVTIQAVERVLASARVPEGSRPATAGEAAGKQLQVTPANDPHLVDRHATYVVPLGIQQAIAWFQANPPPNMRANGTSSRGGPNGLTSAGVQFTERSTSAYAYLTEQVAIYPLDETRAVARVDALADWLPASTRRERVPAHATSVRIVQVIVDPHTVHRATLTGRPVRLLAELINRQHPVTPGQYNCPNDHGDYDVLIFRGPWPDHRFRLSAEGCAFISLSIGGTNVNSTLWGGSRVNALVTRLLTPRR